jgi:hypothetical protein
MILDKTRRNRRSRFTAETRIQLVRCGPEGLPRAGEPATVPAIRWSVASRCGEGTDQRCDGLGPGTRRRLEDQSANRRGVAWGPEVVSGFDPSSSVLLWCCLAQDLLPPSSTPGVVETRRLELLTLSLQRRCSAN